MAARAQLSRRGFLGLPSPGVSFSPGALVWSLDGWCEAVVITLTVPFFDLRLIA